MRDILPSNYSSGCCKADSHSSCPSEWKSSPGNSIPSAGNSIPSVGNSVPSVDSGVPSVRIGHCFSQRQPLKQKMIDLDRTSVAMTRHQLSPHEDLVYNTNGPPPIREFVVVRNDCELSESSTEYSESPDLLDVNREDSDEYDDDMDVSDRIIKVDPRTPSPIPSPPVAEDNNMVWDGADVPSPGSVIIKVEPRTPSPIDETVPEEEAEESEIKDGLLLFFVVISSFFQFFLVDTFYYHYYHFVYSWRKHKYLDIKYTDKQCQLNKQLLANYVYGCGGDFLT